MIKVEHQRAYRLFILSAACHHLLRCRKKSAPVERPSEFVGRSGIPVEAQRTLLGEHEDNESGADNIEHGLEREDGNPAAGETDDSALGRQQASERNRKSKRSRRAASARKSRAIAAARICDALARAHRQ